MGVPYNSQFLWDCLGFRIGRSGIEAYIPYTNPLPSAFSLEYSWPFPQFHRGIGFNFLVVRNPVNSTDYVYTVSDDHQTITQIAVLSWATYGQGGTFDFVDYGSWAIMSNGLVVIFGSPILGWTISKGSGTIPVANAMTDLDGELIAGGIGSSLYDCDQTYVAWSKVGIADFSIDQSNLSGYRKDIWGGIVYDMRQLTKPLLGPYLRRLSIPCIIFSSKGLSIARPVQEPTPTMSFNKLHRIGLINKGAVDGDFQHLVYVGSDYWLREVTEERGVVELGFQYQLQQLAGGGPILVNHDHTKEDNYFIGNGQTTFYLSKYGLTKIQQHPSTVWNTDQGVFGLPVAQDSDSPFIESWPFDFGYAGQKTNEVIELSGEGFFQAEVSVDYRIHDDQEGANVWMTSPTSPINNQNVASLVATADAFRFRVIFGAINSNFRLEAIRSRYKMTDLRAIRGIYAPPLRGQREKAGGAQAPRQGATNVR